MPAIASATPNPRLSSSSRPTSVTLAVRLLWGLIVFLALSIAAAAILGQVFAVPILSPVELLRSIVSVVVNSVLTYFIGVGSRVARNILLVWLILGLLLMAANPRGFSGQDPIALVQVTISSVMLFVRAVAVVLLFSRSSRDWFATVSRHAQ